MRSGLRLRVKALEQRMAEIPQEPKSIMPEWLLEELQKLGIQVNAEGFIDHGEWRAAEGWVDHTGHGSNQIRSHRECRAIRLQREKELTGLPAARQV